MWREQHPAIVRGWRDVNIGFLRAVHDRAEVEVGRVKFGVDGEWAYCELPSDRRIWYYNPRIESEPAFWDPETNRAVVKFDAMKQAKSGGRSWRSVTAYGGLLTENIVQAICRDLMVDAMFRAEAENLPIVLTVHDELVTEHDEKDTEAGERLHEVMTTPASWAPDWPVAAEVWTGKRYRK